MNGMRRIFLASFGAVIASSGNLANARCRLRLKRSRLQHCPTAIDSDVALDQSAAPKNWANVRTGMNVHEVNTLLGPPLKIVQSQLAPVSHWIYGSLEFPSLVFDSALDFSLAIKDGRVMRKDDPYFGQESLDGVPSQPRLLLPYNGSMLHHYPRLVDFRWLPSAGKMPIHYKIEIKVSHQIATRLLMSQIPYLAMMFPGKNSGRWRVQAINDLGESPWSDYFSFQFEI